MTPDLDPRRLGQRVDRALSERIAPATVARTAPLHAELWAVEGEPVPFGAVGEARFEPLAPGTPWGAPWSTAWIRLTGRVPSDWPSDAPVEADVDLGFAQAWPGFQAEGLAYTRDGRILKGVEPRNTHVRVSGAPGDPVEFFVEAAANPDILRRETFSPTPLGHPATAGTAPLYTFAGARLVQRDAVVQALLDDTVVLAGMLDVLPAERPRAARIRRALYAMLGALDPHDVARTATAARAELADVLASPAAASAHRVDAVGHAHIDSAWLWPTRETIRKCARTFSNVLDLMDEDPDLVFACSSAQQYAWIQERYPQLHARIAARIAEGRWVVTGGMWVESDTMMPGGEALVRQFVEGAAYFREAFGVDAAGVWLPDSFGYSAAMPQIAVAAGARWFLTQKLSWNDTNRMPHHTFSWTGIDGTSIFTHFPPSDTYSAQVTVAELDLAERQFTEHAWSSRSLMLFGHGDGGGGPTRSMLAAARRSADLEGLPRVRIVSPDEFFARAIAEQPEPPSWTGELYLELHRGTLTSQARTKAGNRRNEHLLHAAELWCTTATVRLGRAYPSHELGDAWRSVLLLQFHDILPGSSIGWVHDQAEAAHAEISRSLEALIEEAVGALAGDGDLALAANAGPFAIDDVEAGAIAGAPPARLSAVHREGAGFVLEDDVARVRIGADGAITSFIDLPSGREVVPPGERFGLLRLHPDRPARWDAWDIDRQVYDDLELLGEPAGIEHDDRVRFVWRHGASTYEQEWWLDGGELHTRIVIDWYERGRLLKLGLPLDVTAHVFSTETQFGHVTRPVHKNTSWDEARYEVCQHRWLHVGEPGFGVAIANKTAYGVAVDARGSGVDVGVSLLRGAEFPDPAGDVGRHEFCFAIRAGADIREAVALGRALDAPLRELRGARAVEPLVSVESDGIVLETVVLARDGSGDVMVRLSECRGARAHAVVRTTFDWSSVVLTDIHGEELDASSSLLSGVTLDVEERTLAVTDRAFGLITLRFRR